MMPVFFISFILFYVVGIPLSVFIHEIGHALGVILFSKEKAYVYLGTSDPSNKENFRIGRMHFHIRGDIMAFVIRKRRAL